MDKIGHILYCVEEDHDSAALDRAVRVAEKASAKLTVGAFVKPARSQMLLTRGSLNLDEVERLVVEDRQRQLDEAAGSIGDARTEVVARVFVEDPVHAAIKAVQQEGFDLLVKLPSPTQGLRQQLFGSIDMRLMRACPCPVLIGRVKADGYTGHAVAAIACDGGDENSWACSLSSRSGLDTCVWRRLSWTPTRTLARLGRVYSTRTLLLA